MYLLLEDESAVSCRYDQGSRLWVVDKRDFDPDEDDIVSLYWDGDMIDVLEWDIEEESRRCYFVGLVLEDDEYSDSSSDEEVYDDDEDYSEYSDSEEEESSDDDGDASDPMDVSRHYGFK